MKSGAFPIFRSRCIDIQLRPKKSKNHPNLIGLKIGERLKNLLNLSGLKIGKKSKNYRNKKVTPKGVTFVLFQYFEGAFDAVGGGAHNAARVAGAFAAGV